MMDEQAMVETVAQMLIQREMRLGTVECGVDGVVSRRMFGSADGPAVLGDSLILDDVSEAVVLLNLPRPQFKKQGDFSAKASRAAAREGRSVLGVDVCLVVWAPPSDQDWETPQGLYVAVSVRDDVSGETFQFEGSREAARDWIADRALEFIRQALE